MRVVFLLPIYYPEGSGGVERQATILSRSLVAMDVKVTLLAPTLSKDLAGETVDQGIKIVRFHVGQLPYLGGRHLFATLDWTRQVLCWLWRNRDSFDLIFSNHFRLHCLPALLSTYLLPGKPLLGKLGRGGAHFDFRVLQQKKYLYGALIASLLKRRVNRFIANSQEIVADLESFGVDRDRICMIPNGVMIPNLPSNRIAPGPEIVFAGRLDKEKGILKLLDAFAQVAQERPTAVLKIFGAGPLEGEIKTLAAQSPAKDQIKLMGLADTPEAIYSTAQFFVLPSESEGMSNALLEAMSFGLVSIVYDVSGAAELIEHGHNGYLLAQEADLVAPLRACLALPDHTVNEIGAAARATVREYCSLTVVAGRIKNQFETSLGQHAP